MPPNTSVNATFPSPYRESSNEGNSEATTSSSQGPLVGNDTYNSLYKSAGHDEEVVQQQNQQSDPLVPNQNQMTLGMPANASTFQQGYENVLANGGQTVGGIFGGMSPYYGAGFASPYSGGMFSPMGMGTPGPLSNLNQFLFGVQSVIFSLGQAVQIIGTNTQALKQLFDSVVSLVDHAAASWNEMRRLDATAQLDESDEAKRKRRRIKALRLAFVASISFIGYRIVRSVLRRGRSAILPNSSMHPAPSGRVLCTHCGKPANF